ncbi:MAG: NAD(P)H-dependent oxidoreductase subunit E [Candidatus Cloacimonadota bacterium]|nr:MAG: NAD(P)H-dependent oxidoreductase subunit E [Candidatus Cloacimonadota bacterium]
MSQKTQATEPLSNFQRVNEIIEKYGTEKNQLIPILQAVQSEFRYLPQEMLSFIATAMKIPDAEVFGVATFYAQFSTEPKGKHIIQICDGTACHVRGSGKLIEGFRQSLNLSENKITTDDLWVTVETVSCLGACALAPAVVVDGKIYGNVPPKNIQKILDEMKEGDE